MRVRRVASTTLLAAGLAWVLHTPTAFADNCGSPSDCFGAGSSLALAAYGLLLLAGLSFLLDRSSDPSSDQSAQGGNGSRTRQWWDSLLGIPVLGPTLHSGVETAVDSLDAFPVRAFDFAAGALDTVDVLSRNASTMGRYTDNWNLVRAHIPGMDYKKSSWLRSLRHPGLQKVGKLADSTPVHLGSLITRGIDMVDAGGRAVDGFATGDLTQGAEGAADLAASGLKSSKNPVAYLTGLNISIWTEVAKQADDFGYAVGGGFEDIPAPWEGNAWRDVYLQTGWDVVKGVADVI